ncbi:unnamed protein product [Cercopithifilaria johnstoni]|uniref:C2H2-type domain-containing protein n=1 Tax=Cercopithifilaria johnstoni TaxID=2874296 RepID=A0A8J2M9C1_9BILA|nr:unnamed protein product [Cercopithifilaria johnstoni]
MCSLNEICGKTDRDHQITFIGNCQMIVSTNAIKETQTVQTEPLDLSVRKVSEERIQLQNLSINETNKGQTESFSQSSHSSVHKKTHTVVRYAISFSQSPHLTDHVRTHIGEKPHSCTICGESFVKSSDLSRHKRTYAGEKTCSCTMCRKLFDQSDSLKEHENSQQYAF